MTEGLQEDTSKIFDINGENETSDNSQRLIESRKNGEITFSINELDNPTIEAVLNRVPLIYDPITKQLHLQKEFNVLNLNDENGTKGKYCENKVDCEHEIANRNENENCERYDNKRDVEDELEDNGILNSSIFSDSIQNGSLSEDINESQSPFDSPPSVYKTRKLHSISNSLSNASNSISTSLQNVFNHLLRKNGTLPSSTTALILENRPAHLPAKSPDEEEKHKTEYEEMVKEAKRKELKDAKVRRKLWQKKKKEEQQIIDTIKIWQNEILPNWESTKSSKRVQEIWWSGIPPSIREKVWKLAIGNALNLTSELYNICQIRSEEQIWTIGKKIEDGNESIADLIKLDVSRTFPQLGLFQEGGPYHEALSQLLGAYVAYRPDIGYVQGMSFIAGMLLLNMNPKDAFICFANLLNSQMLISFFRVDQKMMSTYYEIFQLFFQHNLPQLSAHFLEEGLSPDLYLVDWIYTLFSRSLPLDVSTHVWDLFLRDRDEFVFRTSIAILTMYKHILLDLDFINLAQYLTKLPDDIDTRSLFTHINAVNMFIGNDRKSFRSILSQFKTTPL